MKLRILGNSLRLRLKRGEVAQLAAGVSVVEETCFPSGNFGFHLDVTEDGDISANFDNGSIDVRVPKQRAMDWAASEEVSLHAEQLVSGAGALSLLIEKDFSCIHPGEHRDCMEDEDTYPHPGTTAK